MNSKIKKQLKEIEELLDTRNYSVHDILAVTERLEKTIMFLYDSGYIISRKGF
jgi:hypothetical protein